MLECEDCGWRGEADDCLHPRTENDGERIDECPKCNSQDLVPQVESP